MPLFAPSFLFTIPCLPLFWSHPVCLSSVLVLFPPFFWMLLIFTSKLRGKSHPNIRMIHNPEGISVLYWTSTDITFSFLTPSFLSWIIKLSCPLPSPYKPGDFWEMCGWGKGVVQRRKLNNMLRNHSFRTYQPSVVHGCLPALASRVFPPIFKCKLHLFILSLLWFTLGGCLARCTLWSYKGKE